jgi:DNA polymerase-2
MAAAHKWLLVTCFGYLGYKNARFGRIEAHQAVTAYSRECLLRAKEAAEDAGYTVLHMYVDGLWVQSTNGTNETNVANGVRRIQPLLDEIAARTHLPIALEGIYRWVAFLPSRVNDHVPVANRYFGVFQDGSIKVRGIEARRRDAPPFIAQTQMAILERLATAQDASQLHETIPGVVAFLRGQLRRLRLYQVPLDELLVTQKLSRELELYRSPSPAARAAAQLEAIGKAVRPGQPVRFLYTRGKARSGGTSSGGVHAWDCPPPPAPQSVDIDTYSKLFLRACAAVLQPLGVDEEELRSWLLGGAGTFARPLRLFH